MRKERLYVDFNEMPESNLVLLSAEDVKRDVTGARWLDFARRSRYIEFRLQLRLTSMFRIRWQVAEVGVRGTH
ncbi:hypothetical protein [Peristeroidobacter agariperforans]|uniref:hypothetical protein n=1 Tax=Peristeroidobacter agariperforans TaxID=268404 RepID=UPI00101D748C|nr:hypothetical protein [Peristeroidobacter agariperforans]